MKVFQSSKFGTKKDEIVWTFYNVSTLSIPIVYVWKFQQIWTIYERVIAIWVVMKKQKEIGITHRVN